jgi:putative transposase
MQLGWFIEMDAPAALPISWRLDRLMELAGNPKELRILPPAATERPLKVEATDEDVYKLRWGRVSALVDDPMVFFKETRGGILTAHGEAIGIHPRTLLRNLRQWWQGGQCKEALLGNYWRSGRLDDAQNTVKLERKTDGGTEVVVFTPPSQKGRGRPPIHHKYDPYPISPQMAQAIINVAWDHIKADASKSMWGAATRVREALFSIKDENGKPLRDKDGAAVLRPRGQRPTDAQIRRLLRKAKSDSAKYKAQYGKATFDNEVQAKFGSVLNDTRGPGDVFEIDSTIIDLHLVDTATRKKIIGKATLYLVIDRYTRLIVGFHLSLENPSWAEALQAILSISGDWEALCKRLGVAYMASDWPAQGRLCNRFFADRADMIVGASDAVCEGVLTQVTNAPPLHSSDKAIVESGFKTIHTPLRQWAPGYEPPETLMKRRQKAFWKGAVYSLDDMAAVFLRAIINHNRTYKPGFSATPAQIMSGASLAPKDLWNREVVRHIGLGSRMSADDMRRHLLPQATATVTQFGIHLKHCYYMAPKEWCTRAAMHGNFEIKVSYTSNLVNTILIHHPDGRTEVTELTKASHRLFNNYSFAEVHAVYRAGQRLKAIAKERAEGHQVAMLQDIDEITAKAKAQVDVATAGLRHAGQRLGGADEARVEEQRSRRAASHGLDKPPAPYQRDAAPQELPSAPAPVTQVAPSLPAPPAPTHAPGTPAAMAPTPAAQGYSLPSQPDTDDDLTDPDVMDDLFNLVNQDTTQTEETPHE